MKKVAVVGMGLGADTLTPEALAALARADVLLGSPRALDLYKSLYKDSAKPAVACYLPRETAAAVLARDAETFAVLVSGDTGFYSAAAGLAETLSGCELRFIPGVSSVSAFFARLKLPWQEAAFISAHGRDIPVADTVRRSRLTFCLTGNNVNAIGAALAEAGFGTLQAYVGENLGTPRERVFAAAAGDLARGDYPPLTVLLFINEAFDDGIPCGLPDHCFSRLAGLPMTKSETRALIVSKLRLRPASLCWDIGAGTGSVTVEMALHAWRGRVYALERRADAIPLIRQNCAAFHLGNVTALCGEAPAALLTLPAPEAVFIGGSGGGLGGIISAAWRKNPDARVVLSAVTPETVAAALATFREAGAEAEIIQMHVARGKPAGGLHLMEALNPITILCAGGKP